MRYPQVLVQYAQSVELEMKLRIRGFSGPSNLIDAMSYSLFAGGKRIRPALLLAARDLFPQNGLDPMPAACALEMIHTYSLIHDDLPAMDDDDLRRGIPASHKKFGEAMAILAGDALLTEAFRIMAFSYSGVRDAAVGQVIAEIAAAAGCEGMVGGQVIDSTQTGSILDQASLEELHRMKTGALIRSSVRSGAILGHATNGQLEAVSRYGDLVGLAFQVADDVLDVTSTAGELGKSTGKDHAQGKTTYVSLLGVDDSRKYARELAGQAAESLTQFGPRAGVLCSLAGYIAARSC